MRFELKIRSYWVVATGFNIDQDRVQKFLVVFPDTNRLVLFCINDDNMYCQGKVKMRNVMRQTF